MPKHLLFGGGGLVFGENPNELVNIDLPSPTSGFVPTLQCAGGTEPSVVLTVSGSSGTVNWCGETWNLPGDSGSVREVCPTNYQLQQVGTPSSFSNREYWRFDYGVHADLVFQRRARESTYYTGINTTRFIIFGIVDTLNRIRDSFRRTTGGPINTVKNSIGLLTANSAGQPTFSDYKIGNAWFGSFVDAGITYSWARGTNW